MALSFDDRPPASTLPSAMNRRGSQVIQVAGIRALSAQTCAVMRSPRAIAYWLIARHDSTTEPTELALDREEAALWSMALTGRFRVTPVVIDGLSALELAFTDGEFLSITMDELRAASAAIAA